MMTYSEKLRDPRWQKKRLKILERDGFACVSCESGLQDGKTLHVHHKRYANNPWDVADDDLETLCEACHAETTERFAELKRISAYLNATTVGYVAGFAKGVVQAFEGGDCHLVNAEEIAGFAIYWNVSDKDVRDRIDKNGNLDCMIDWRLVGRK